MECEWPLGALFEKRKCLDSAAHWDPNAFVYNWEDKKGSLASSQNQLEPY